MSRLAAQRLNRLADLLFRAGDLCVRLAYRLDPNNEFLRELDAAAAEWDQGHNNGGIS
jgi:hypothetical protein